MSKQWVQCMMHDIQGQGGKLEHLLMVAVSTASSVCTCRGGGCWGTQVAGNG